MLGNIGACENMTLEIVDTGNIGYWEYLAWGTGNTGHVEEMDGLGYVGAQNVCLQNSNNCRFYLLFCLS